MGFQAWVFRRGFSGMASNLFGFQGTIIPVSADMASTAGPGACRHDEEILAAGHAEVEGKIGARSQWLGARSAPLTSPEKSRRNAAIGEGDLRGLRPSLVRSISSPISLISLQYLVRSLPKALAARAL